MSRRIDTKTITTKNKMLMFVLISVSGMLFRLTGLYFEGVDYRASLLPWFTGFTEYPGLTGLGHFRGDYNLPYVTILWLLSRFPIAPIISIKLSSVFFDYVLAFMLSLFAGHCVPKESKDKYRILVYGLVLLNPVAIINSGYLAQCESLWASLAIISFYFVWKDKPALGMLFFGFAFAMKPQGIFILPLLLIMWFYKRSFSILHTLWIPVGIQLLCIPAILGGCPFDVFLIFFKKMMGHYPFVYYYYPNFWVYLKDLPYYVFGKAGIFSAFVVLLVFAILFIKSKREHTPCDYLEYITFTTMTCAMILPCMHERYNYMAEIVLVVCSVFRPGYRLAAVLLVLSSLQCNGASYLGWPFVSHELLAVINIAVYLYLARHCLISLYQDTKYRPQEEHE